MCFLIIGVVIFLFLSFYFDVIGYLFTVLTIIFVFWFSKTVSQENEDILMLEKNKQKKEWINKKKELEEKIFLDPHNKGLKDQLEQVKTSLKDL